MRYTVAPIPILALAFAGSFFVAFAAPFLVADAPPADQQITHYNIYQDGVDIATFYGEVLSYDLAGVVPGAYNWTVEACNVWGCEMTPDPYISPGGAGSPMNLKLIP